MTKCPVCSTQLHGPVCSECGFDRSRHYEAYPTFAPIPSGLNTVSRLRADREEGWLRCEDCGGTTFRFRLSAQVPVCVYCRKEAVLPKVLDPLPAKLAAPVLQKPAGRTIVAIAQGYYHTVALYSDGTVRAAGDNEDGQCNVQSWGNITAIAAGDFFTIGLNRDGTVIATGENDDGQCNVSRWSGITAIAAGGSHTLGLKKDGTACFAGYYDWGNYDVSCWKELKGIAAGAFHSLGLRTDGTSFSSEETLRLSRRRELTALDGGSEFSVGLRKDGTVIAAGKNDEGQCDVAQWSGITAIAAGDYHTVGLKQDGTLVHAGWAQSDQLNALKWKDIVAIAAGGFTTVGLKKDGTLVCTDSQIEAAFQTMK